MTIEFKYFSAEPGRAVARFGTGSHIGATKTPKGFVINSELVARVPETEVLKFSKEYRQAVVNGDLRERTKEDYDAQQKAREEAEESEASAAEPKPPEAEPTPPESEDEPELVEVTPNADEPDEAGDKENP